MAVNNHGPEEVNAKETLMDIICKMNDHRHLIQAVGITELLPFLHRCGMMSIENRTRVLLNNALRLGALERVMRSFECQVDDRKLRLTILKIMLYIAKNLPSQITQSGCAVVLANSWNRGNNFENVFILDIFGYVSQDVNCCRSLLQIMILPDVCK